jgi:dTDP-L-rhamnose 4-epimerase
VLDVVEANMKALRLRDKPYRTFNVGTGEPTKIIDLADKLIRIFGVKDLGTNFAKSRVGEIKHSYADTSRSEIELGYTPSITLNKGLKMTVKWCLEHEMRSH